MNPKHLTFALFILTFAGDVIAAQYADPSGFSFTYPEGWQVAQLSTGNFDALPEETKNWIQKYKVYAQNTKVMVLGNGDADYFDNAGVAVVPLVIEITDDSMKRLIAAETRMPDTQINVIFSAVQQVGHHRAIILEVEAHIPGIPFALRQRQMVVAGAGVTYTVTCSSKADKFAANSAVFNSILESFEITGAVQVNAVAPTGQNESAVASDGWPDYPLPAPTQFHKNRELGRGPGFYFSLFKIALVCAIFFLWVKTTDWVSQDSQRLGLNYLVWNSVVFGVFAAAFLLLWILPWFEVAYAVLAIAYLAPLGVYLIIRNKAVEAHHRVLTPDHLRHVFADVAGLLGVKISTEKKYDYQKGPPVQFKASSGGGRDGEANILLARRSAGYVPTKEMVADMLDRRGDSIMLEFTPQNVSVRYQIDGVWHNVDPLEVNNGNLILAVLKTMAGLDANERVKRQEGMFPADYRGVHYGVKLQTKGVETGEQAVLHFHPTKAPVHTLEELGMRAKTQEQLKELLNQPKGFVIFSSLPYGGLSNLFDAALKSCDRYMRDFAAVEDVNQREHEIENIQVTTYNSALKETPLPALEKIVRTYPNALVVRTLTDGETAKFLCEQVGEDRLVLTALRAKDAPETLLRVLMLKVPPKDFVGAVTGVVCVRLIRKLCDECKEEYPAPPEILQQFGIPPGKVQSLYRPPTQTDPKKPCPHCQGIGYFGRTGLFELIVVDDGVREVLTKSPKLDLVRAAARRGGMKTFQEEGLVLVVKGVTSLAELQRAMKQ